MENEKYVDPSSDPNRYTLDNLGCGYLFADTFSDRLRYVMDAKNWYFFDGCLWREDIGGIFACQCAKLLVEHLKSHGQDDYADLLTKRTQRETMIKDAMDVNPLTLSDFDADPHLLNCLNGTIDLRTGQFREHNSADFLSKKADVAYDPNAKCERWEQFVDEIMCHDAELAVYLQKTLGYSLSGDTCEECLFIFYGPTTRNGKGTLMETAYNLLGDYSLTMQPNSLAQRKRAGSSHSADIARLAGCRFVNVSELPSEYKLNAAIVKQLTGGDTVTTRYLYKNFFEYRPQFKIFINTNHLPEIEDDTLFSSGRLRLIPFDRHFKDNEQDRGLKKLFREDINKSAILNWFLDGYKLYMADKKLTPPPRAEELLRQYRKTSDTIGLYIENRLIPSNGKERMKTMDFYTNFQEWCKEEGVSELSLKEFVNAFRQKDLVYRDRVIGNYIKGYILKPNK